jgi:hypothetical protein
MAKKGFGKIVLIKNKSIFRWSMETYANSQTYRRKAKLF